MELDIKSNRPQLGHIISNVAKGAEQKRYRPRVSNSGSCPRALTYAALGTQGSGGGNPVLLFDGSLHEDATVHWLKQGGCEVILRQQGLDIGVIEGEDSPPWFCEFCEKEIAGNILHGHIDGVIDDGNHYYLFEHKGLGDFGFDNLSREFPVGYITQSCAYIKGLQNAGFEISSGLLFVKNKNNSDYRQIYIEYDSETDIARVENEWNGHVDLFASVVRDLIDLHQVVAVAKQPGANLPARPYDQDHWKCIYCDFREPCWSTHAQEVSNFVSKEKMSRDSKLGRAVAELMRVRGEKATVSEQEKVAKRAIHSLLGELQIRSGETEDFKFWLSPFEKKTLDENRIPADIVQAATRRMTFQSIKIKTNETGARSSEHEQ